MAIFIVDLVVACFEWVGHIFSDLKVIVQAAKSVCLSHSQVVVVNNKQPQQKTTNLDDNNHCTACIAIYCFYYRNSSILEYNLTRMPADPLPVPAQLNAQLNKCKTVRNADAYHKSREKSATVRNSTAKMKNITDEFDCRRCC
jgi:hypothetical protein